MRFPLRSGAAYLKLLPAGLRHEVEVTRLLATWVPERVVRVLASNAARGWLLMAEGGRRAREEIRDREDLHRWADAVREYADLQIRVAPRAGELLAAGAPDLRAEQVPRAFEALLRDEGSLLVGQPAGLTAETLERLRDSIPAVAELAAELAHGPIPNSIQHDDLHDGNVFVADGGHVVFDWGDACVAHPFGSLVVALRSVRFRFELAPGAQELRTIRDAYLGRWLTFAPTEVLERHADIAQRLAYLSRALAWKRALAAVPASEWGEDATAVPGWLEEMLEVLGTND